MSLKAKIKKNYLNEIGRLIDGAYSHGWADGYDIAKEEYANANKGIAKCKRATPEDRERWGLELYGWCTECNKAIEGRWVGLGNFCPWCGRAMEWHDKEEKEDEQ